MTTDITLYTNSEIRRERNAGLANVTTYLAQRVSSSKTTATKVSGVQFLKVYDGLIQTVKLPLDGQITPFKATKTYDYAMVEVYDGETLWATYYYFVDDMEWISTTAIKLYMTCDVIQTFFCGADTSLTNYAQGEGKYLKLMERTHVTREHKNRWKEASVYDHPSPGSTLVKTVLRADIDLFDEGLNVPLFRTERREILDKNDLRYKWNLVYKNANQPDPDNPANPVNIFIASDKWATVTANTVTKTIDVDDVFSDDVRTVYLHGSFSVKINNVTYNCNSDWYALTRGFTAAVLYGVTLNDGDLVRGTVIDNDVHQLETSEITLTGRSYSLIIPATVSYASTDDWSLAVGSSTTLIWGVEERDFDRSDERLIKIIKCPYAPVPITYNSVSDIFEISAPFWIANATEQMFQLTNPAQKFKNTVFMNINNPIGDLEHALMTSWVNTLRSAHGDEDESKLLSSRFHSISFTYDSFTLPIMLEHIDQQYPVTSSPYFTFHTTSTINSRFLFVLPYRVRNYPETYNWTLSVSRNNEALLLNSSYINYVRTGYNYDVKAKQRQWITAGVGAGASILGGIAAGAMASNPVTGVIAATVGVAASIISTINSQISSSEQIARRLDDAERQAVSVSGSDDIDLLEAYGRNHAWLTEFDPSPAVRKSLADLFYLCGYACDERKKPNLSTRDHFNFIQCDPMLEPKTRYVPKWAIDECAKRFREGLTIFHVAQCNLGDIETEYMNLENSLDAINIYLSAD